MIRLWENKSRQRRQNTSHESPFGKIRASGGGYYKGDLFCRFYAKDNLYFQPMVSAGYDIVDNEKSAGVSFSFGFKKVYPKSHITLDASIGLQFYPYYEAGDAAGSIYWYSVGMGSILIPRVSIGYAF